jgi:putative addiction module component (TIGR02574 family)
MANRRGILPELLKLPAHERARLAAELVQSLDESEDSDAVAAWLEELDRRAGEVVNGAAKLEAWTKVRRRIELRLRRARV